jgi:hypothetical protein
MRRRVLFPALAVLLGIATALGAAEIVLRLTGHLPRQYVSVDPRIPVLNEPDHVLGWQPKPGAYLIPPFTARSKPIRVTVQADRSRVTGSPGDRAEKLLLIGCSFTFGWGVGDEDSFAWKLHDQLPSYDVINHGVGGYGTYQSLLLLEQMLAQGPPPARVLYGYMQGHEARNVAHPLWTFSLTKYSRQGLVEVPFCTLDGDGHLQRRPAEHYPAWPLEGDLAVVNFLEESYMRREAMERTAEAQQVTDLLMLEMGDLCRRHGVKFAVVLLYADDAMRDHYSRLLREHDVDLIDCARPLTAETRVPGDGHPNARLHAEWATCIAAALTEKDGAAARG